MTVPPLPKRIHIQITVVLINSQVSTEYFRTGVVLATYSNVTFIVASCTEGIPLDHKCFLYFLGKQYIFFG